MTRLWIVCFLLSANAFAQTTPKAQPDVPVDVSTEGASQPKLMDGVELEAVETYVNPKQNQLGVGIGLYPFDGYFYGLSINAGYTYHFSRTFAWEVVNAQYFFSFQKDLATELVQDFNVSPRVIDSLTYIFSSDVQYVFAYGKMAMMEEYVRYFRCSGLAGLGVAKTSLTNPSFAMILGLKLEAFTRDSFSWTFEIRDALAIPGFDNYMTFTLGTGISF